MMNNREMEQAIELEQKFVKGLTSEQKTMYWETAVEIGGFLHAEKACKKVVIPVTGAPLIGSGSYSIRGGEFSVFRGKDNDIVIFCHGNRNGGLLVMRSVMDMITKGYFKGDDKPVEVTGEGLKSFVNCFAKMCNAVAVTIVCCYGGMNEDFVVDGVPVTFTIRNKRAAIYDCGDYIENEIVVWEGDDLTEIYYNILPLLM